MRIRFGDWELDAQLFVLARAGRRVPIRPKVFDLLIHLVRHRERVVPRDELARLLWGQTVVGAGSLSGLVNELRNALGESGAGDSSIRTVHARGYQFVAEVVSAAAPGTASTAVRADSADPRATTRVDWIDELNRHRTARDLLGELSASRSKRLQFGFSRFVREELRALIEAEGIAPASASEVRSVIQQLLLGEEERNRRACDDGAEEISLGPERRMRVTRSAPSQARHRSR